jgi:hypothetical protein
MTQLQVVTLGLVTLAAMVSLVALSIGLYELITGRLTPGLTRLRRRIPATTADIRDNAIGLVLGEVATMLMALLILGNVFVGTGHGDRYLPGVFFAVSLAGFLSAFACALASFLIRRNVRFVNRKAAAPSGPSPADLRV